MNSVARSRSLAAVVIVAIGYAALCTVVTRRGAPLPPDAVEYAQVAKSLASGQGFTIDYVEFHPGFLSSIRHPLELHGVLTPFALAPLFRIWGPNTALVRIPGIAACAGIVIAVFALAQQCFGTRAGLLAALGFLMRTDVIAGAVLGADDVGWTLFSTLAVLYFLRGFELGRQRVLVAAGIFAALATLQKYTGVLLAALLCPMLLVRGSTMRARLRDSMAVGLPVLLAAAVYALKNHVTHGGFGSRFTALDWLSREDPSAYFAYYESAPRLSEVWAHMGFLRVVKLCAAQAKALWGVVVANKVTTFGGLAALAWASRAKQRIDSGAPNAGALLGRLGLLYSALLAVVVCVVYHVEPRYLFALIPLYYAAMAGAAVEVFDRVSIHLPERAFPYVRAAICVACTLLLGRLAIEIVRSGRKLEVVMQKTGSCDDTFEFIRRSVPRNEPVLSSSPWYVTWLTDRPSVAAPSNGAKALVTVAKHYDVRWAVTELPTFGGAKVEEELRALTSSGGQLRPTRVFDGATCDVYRLEP